VPFDAELSFARHAATLAGDLALRFQRDGVPAELKSDDSPVTIADREAEALLVRLISETFPNDGILGEEGAARPSLSGRRWILDPVDGTRDFVRNTSRWAVLVALEQFEGGPILAGVAHFPGSGETFHATLGGGAFKNDRPIFVSPTANFSEAVIHLNGLIAPQRMPYRERLLDWCQGAFAIRSMGGAPDAMLLAEGNADIWIEPSCKPWDLAPLKVICQEAGARFCSFSGEDTIYANNCLIFTPTLEEKVWQLIRP
jgi:fructose-1,6-bisphosphatase/inositol monophosphatase family enzyme